VKLQIPELILGKQMSRTRYGALEKCSPDFTLPTTLVELFSLKLAINKKIKMLEYNDKLRNSQSSPCGRRPRRSKRPPEYHHCRRNTRNMEANSIHGRGA
jgi:hypothetical protein